MPKSPTSLDSIENRLGLWPARYQPPRGSRFPGQLTLTTRHLIFEFEMGAAGEKIRPLVTGPIDTVAVAYAFDLDLAHVLYANWQVCVALPLECLERVVTKQFWLNNWIEVTLKDNGSIHVLERGMRPVAPIAQAIQSAQAGTK